MRWRAAAQLLAALLLLSAVAFAAAVPTCPASGAWAVASDTAGDCKDFYHCCDGEAFLSRCASCDAKFPVCEYAPVTSVFDAATAECRWVGLAGCGLRRRGQALERLVDFRGGRRADSRAVTRCLSGVGWGCLA